MLCTSKICSFSIENYLGTSLIIGSLMRNRVTLTFRWKGKRTTKLELSNDELVDGALRTNYAQEFDLNVDLDSKMLLHLQ
jgi:hypothetical protein